MASVLTIVAVLGLLAIPLAIIGAYIDSRD